MSYEDYDDDEYAPSRRGPRGDPKKRRKGRGTRDGPGPSRVSGRDKIKRRGASRPGPQYDDEDDFHGRRRRPAYDDDRGPPRERRGPPKGGRRSRDRYMEHEVEYTPPPRKPPRGGPAYDDMYDEPMRRDAPSDFEDMYKKPRKGMRPPPDDYYDRGTPYDHDRDEVLEPGGEHPIEPVGGPRGPREKRPSYTSLDVPMDKARRSRQTSFLFIGLCIIIIVTWFV